MLDSDELQATETQLEAARKKAKMASVRSALIGIILIPVVSIPVFLGAAYITKSWDHYLIAAAILVVLFAPGVVILLRYTQQQQDRGDELMRTLEIRLREAVEAARYEANRREIQVKRQQFETRLANALEMAEGEPEVIEVIERAFGGIVPDSPVELLLADNSQAHLSRVAVSSPTGEPPKCGVDSPDHCPAARRAQVQRFADSEELDACPKLRGRELGRCSAVCVPVSIMGRTVGVIHATAGTDFVFEESLVEGLGTLAKLAGARIGLLRIMSETQLQASTDSLTGLLNRRSLENRVRQIRTDATCAVAMADLDRFKELNDTYGHEAGDRALRLFAQTLKGSVRAQDLVCRHGGEEFLIVFPHCGAENARSALKALLTKLDVALAGSGLPSFTVSVGVVELEAGADFLDAISRADAALFQAKAEGRDRIVAHDSEGATLPDPALDLDEVNGMSENSLLRRAQRSVATPSTKDRAEVPATVGGPATS